MNNFSDIFKKRRSTRAFIDKEVSDEVLKEILILAGSAPSAVNMQPWYVVVLGEKKKAELSKRLIEAHEKKYPQDKIDLKFYPDEWFEPYKTRRKECGLALFKALGITRDNPKAREEAWLDNYRFFKASRILLIFTDRNLPAGSVFDTGIFTGFLMLAAKSKAVSSCPMASLAEHPDIVREVLDEPDNRKMLAGVVLGYEDEQAAVNQYSLAREPIDKFVRFTE